MRSWPESDAVARVTGVAWTAAASGRVRSGRPQRAEAREGGERPPRPPPPYPTHANNTRPVSHVPVARAEPGGSYDCEEACGRGERGEVLKMKADGITLKRIFLGLLDEACVFCFCNGLNLIFAW